jgi:hypothetical protein
VSLTIYITVETHLEEIYACKPNRKSSIEKKISTAASTPDRIEPSKNNTAQASPTEMLRLSKEKKTPLHYIRLTSTPDRIEHSKNSTTHAKLTEMSCLGEKTPLHYNKINTRQNRTL